MSTTTLPTADGGTADLQFGAPARLPLTATRAQSRRVVAAAHVVADPRLACASDGGTAIDWDATLRLRHRLFDLGLGVAEAMDTAQRGMGLSWASAHELARRTLVEAQAVGGDVVVGIATDQLPPGPAGLDTIAGAYGEQLAAISALGGQPVVMASRHLAAAATGPDDYKAVYAKVLGGAERPVVLHWLGTSFDPALAGYWGHDNPWRALDVVAEIMTEHADRIDGIKVSLLDAELEAELRRRVPLTTRVYTGDDFHYVDTIVGDGDHHSHALLGAFAAVPQFAAAAFARLDAGDVSGFRDLLGPTEHLSRLIFEAPTQYYKVGVAWLAHLCGHQDHLRMLGGFETGRSLLHLAELVRAGDRIGLFPDPDLAAERVTRYFSAQGIR